MIERPFDFLNDLKGKEVIITLKDANEIRGKLLAFDIHINLVVLANDDDPDDDPNVKIKKNLFVRGDTVVFVESNDETGK